MVRVIGSRLKRQRPARFCLRLARLTGAREACSEIGSGSLRVGLQPRCNGKLLDRFGVERLGTIS